MRSVSRLSPASVYPGPGALLRLTVCLAMLHAGGHAGAETSGGGYGASAAVELGETHVEAKGGASGGGIGFVAAHGDGKVEGDGDAPGQPIIAVGKVPGPIDEGAGEVAVGTGEVARPVGECSGRRFKKCR